MSFAAGPWRNVKSVEVDESMGRRWKMLLDCGHVAWRSVSYRPTSEPRPPGRRWPGRSLDERMPDPQRSQCWQCGRAETAATCENRQETP